MYGNWLCGGGATRRARPSQTKGGKSVLPENPAAPRGRHRRAEALVVATAGTLGIVSNNGPNPALSIPLFPATLWAMQLVMDSSHIQTALADFAAHIMSDRRVATHGPHAVAIVGIRSRGELLAQRIAAAIEARYAIKPDVGALDITMYRDDLSGRKAIAIPLGTDMNFRLDDRIVFLIDDVLHTGRTIRAALDALVDFGRPRAIHAMALIDRGGREYPIAADHVGLKLDAPAESKVIVHLMPTDAEDAVYVDS